MPEDLINQSYDGLTLEQVSAKRSLIENRYTYADFKEDWKTLEVGGKEEAIPYLGIAASMFLCSPGGAALCSNFIGLDSRYAIFLGIVGMATSTWFAGDSLFQKIRDRNRAKTVHKWSTFKSSKPPKAKEDDLLIGYTTDKMLPFRIPANELMRHGYILGMSGVGKTVVGKLMMYQQIVRGGGLIFVDGKLDSTSYNELYAMACLCGRRDDFLIINPGNPEESNTYNPVLYGDPDEVTARIMTLISNSTGDSAFYRSQATQAIGVLIAALQCLGKAYCFMDLVTLLISDKAIISISNALSQDDYKNDARAASFQLWASQFMRERQYKDGETLKYFDTDVLKKNLGGLLGELFRFATGDFGKIMNSYDPEISLYRDILANKIIYVALPTMGKAEASASLGKMFIGDFRSAIAKIQALPEEQRPGWKGSEDHPAKLAYFAFMDELGAYGVENMDKIFEQGRSAGLACFPATQTTANLEKVSKEFLSQVVGNTWTKIFFKVGVNATAEEVSNLIGMTRRAARSEGETTSESKGAQVLQANPQAQSNISENEQNTIREGEEFLVHPDLLKSLEIGECVVFYGGNHTYHLKVPYISVTKAGYEKVGKMQINHRKPKRVNGIYLYDKMVKLINKEFLEEVGGPA